MSFSERHNKRTFDIPFDTSNFRFMKCSELDDSTHRVYGYFSSIGMYGKHYSLILEGGFLNLPKYLTSELDKFTSEDNKEIQNGKVGVEKQEYYSNGQKCYTIKWVDLK